MEEVDGKAKFDIAKEVVEAVAKKLPEGTHVGLRVYGHRFTALQQKEAETDSELVIPIAPLKPEAFIARVKALRCRGKTPITHSLREAAKDVAGVPAEVELTTLLLTDGGESTRGAKPAEAARQLVAARKGMKLHVVGFDINQDDWKEQLQEVAAAGGGRYFHCAKASELLGALAVATTGASDYALLDKEGKELLKGKLGDRHELPEGK
jgi:Ca-activated chloride channel family protein